MASKLYNFVLTGTTALIMHADDINGASAVSSYRSTHSKCEKGSDRAPGWTWLTYLYTDMNGVISMPVDNIMKCLTAAGTKVKTGVGRATYKTAIASNIQPYTSSDMFELQLPITDATGIRTWGTLNKNDFKAVYEGEEKNLADIDDFETQVTAALNHGIMLFTKRAKIGENKHIRVRPRFDSWRVLGRLEVLDPEECRISAQVLENIFMVAGRQIGLCDWRPSSPSSPGSYGKFTAEITPII